MTLNNNNSFDEISSSTESDDPENTPLPVSHRRSRRGSKSNVRQTSRASIHQSECEAVNKYSGNWKTKTLVHVSTTGLVHIDFLDT